MEEVAVMGRFYLKEGSTFVRSMRMSWVLRMVFCRGGEM